MLNETRKSDEDLLSRVQEAAVLRNIGYFLGEGLLFIAVPEWEGWKYLRSETSESTDHFARWEVFFYPRSERFLIFLRVTWPSFTQILLSFLYPDDRKLLEEIILHRRLVLLDQPLLNSQPNPLSSGVIVDDIPTDIPEVFGIGFDHGKKTIH